MPDVQAWVSASCEDNECGICTGCAHHCHATAGRTHSSDLPPLDRYGVALCPSCGAEHKSRMAAARCCEPFTEAEGLHLNPSLDMP